MIDIPYLRLIEAILFASAQPMHEDELVRRLPAGADIHHVLTSLQNHYQGRGVELVRRDQGWCFRTAMDLAGSLSIETHPDRKLSRAAIEILAIIAYHQPVTRAEIDEIRGVSISKGTLDVLFDAGWVKLAGRRRSPGKPMQWQTTEAFLDHFSLASLDDLPGLEELKSSGLLDKSAIRPSYGSQPDDMIDQHEKEDEEADAMSGS